MQPECFHAFSNSISNNYSRTCAIADTGSTDHYINSLTPQIKLTEHQHALPTVTLPDSSIITASHAAPLPLSSHLSHEAILTYSFPSIAKLLVSIGKFCDDNCVATSAKNNCFVLQKDNIDLQQYIQHSFLTGNRGHNTKLWNFDLDTTPHSNSVNKFYELKIKELPLFITKLCSVPRRRHG